MLVKPNKNYKMLSTNKCVWVDQTYKAIIATNQPNYKEKGAIFVNEILLEKGEYTIVENFTHEDNTLYYTDMEDDSLI